METDLRAWIAGAALFVVLVQWYFANRKEKFDSTMWVFERLQDIDAIKARFAAKALVEKAAGTSANAETKEGFSHTAYEFDRLSDDERATLSSIGGLFGLAGLLYERGKINRALFLEAWGNSVVVNFERLTPFMRWRDERLGRHRSMWRHFERLAAIAILHRSKTPP